MLNENKYFEANLQTSSNKLIGVEYELRSMKVDLEEARMDELLSRDQWFEKVRKHVPYLHPKIDLTELDLIKVVVEGRLVEETNPMDDQILKEEIKVS